MQFLIVKVKCGSGGNYLSKIAFAIIIYAVKFRLISRKRRVLKFSAQYLVRRNVEYIADK